MSAEAWALDPWSEEPRWIAVPPARMCHKIPRPGDASPRKLGFMSYDNPRAPVEYITVHLIFPRPAYVPMPEVSTASLRAFDLLRLAEVAIVFVMAIKRMTEGAS